MTQSDDVAMAGPRLAIRVAELIRVAHEKSGLSHDEIAARLDVSVGRVSQILNGDGNFHIATVGRILAALDVSPQLNAVDHDGHAIEMPKRRRSGQVVAVEDERRAARATSSAPVLDSVHVYQLSLVGEVGGLEGWFVSNHRTRRQSLAGGHMTPIAETIGRAPMRDEQSRSASVNFTTELVEA